MAMMAKCLSCGVENSPMNATCDVCKAPLGTALVEGGRARSPIMFMWISLAITVGLFLPCWFLKMHPSTLLLAMFYGPLIASYQAKDNVVFNAALGGLLGAIAVVGLSIVLSWETSRPMLTSLIGGEPPESRSYGPDYPGTGAVTLLLLGIPLLLVAVLPLSLIGASVGEHLSIWRRRRTGTAGARFVAAPAMPEPARKLTDEEIAKIEL